MKLTELEEKEITNRIEKDVNIENIYRLFHRFRDFNDNWNEFMKVNPKDIDIFARMLSEEFEIKIKK